MGAWTGPVITRGRAPAGPTRGEVFLAAVEVRPCRDGRAPVALLEAAYEASVAGVVALVLFGTTTMDVDAALDSAVAAHPLDIPGVRYVDGHDQAAVAAAVRGAAVVFGSGAFLAVAARFTDGRADLRAHPARRAASGRLAALGSVVRAGGGARSRPVVAFHLPPPPRAPVALPQP